MEKVIRNGKVAVLISPGYGAGFYTWDAPLEAIFHPTLVDLIEKEQIQEAIEFVKLMWPEVYTGGVKNLKIQWLNEGEQFQIDEYDGSESLIEVGNIDWITA